MSKSRDKYKIDVFHDKSREVFESIGLIDSLVD